MNAAQIATDLRDAAAWLNRYPVPYGAGAAAVEQRELLTRLLLCIAGKLDMTNTPPATVPDHQFVVRDGQGLIIVATVQLGPDKSFLTEAGQRRFPQGVPKAVVQLWARSAAYLLREPAAVSLRADQWEVSKWNTAPE